MEISSSSPEDTECGNYQNWNQVFLKIDELIISDQPTHIAVVTEEELKSGYYMGVDLHAVSLAQMQQLCMALYKSNNLTLFLRQIPTSKGVIKMIVVLRK